MFYVTTYIHVCNVHNGHMHCVYSTHVLIGYYTCTLLYVCMYVCMYIPASISHGQSVAVEGLTINILLLNSLV